MEAEEINTKEIQKCNSAVGDRGGHVQTFTEIRCAIDDLCKQTKDSIHVKNAKTISFTFRLEGIKSHGKLNS